MNATANRVTPLREPECSWEERQLTAIIVHAMEAAAMGAGPHTLCRYLVGAMDWFVAARDERAGDPPPLDVPADPFEAWLIARWLREIRSDEFRDSVQGQRLMAEWERGR